jgi:hypothetical protein
MSEIITLQLGSYANFVGSHYWNIQVRRYQVSVPQRDMLHVLRLPLLSSVG